MQFYQPALSDFAGQCFRPPYLTKFLIDRFPLIQRVWLKSF